MEERDLMEYWLQTLTILHYQKFTVMIILKLIILKLKLEIEVQTKEETKSKFNSILSS